MSSEKINVIGVLLLISFIYVTFIDAVVLPFDWFSFNAEFSRGGVFVALFNVVIIHFWLIMIVYVYLLSVFVPGGEVPKDWTPENCTEQELNEAKTRDDSIHCTKKAIWCHDCLNFKPPRTHHCRTCNKCCLKMDHHCKWTGNCVGYFNHKYFCLFLFYASIGLAHTLLLFLWRTVDIFYIDKNPIFRYKILLGLNYLITLPVTIGIMVLLKHQWRVVSRNTTSIEVSKRKWQEIDAKNMIPPENFRWFYDYGLMENIKDTMGPSIPTWFVPQNQLGDGLKFRESREVVEV